MKIVKSGDISLVSENEFTKIFKYNDIDLYISKAYDDESDRHFLVASIPKIEELNVGNIQQPFVFENEEARDESFKNLDINVAKGFLDSVIEEIKKQKKAVEDEK